MQKVHTCFSLSPSILIQRSRYNTYLDTYLNTIRCQSDVMSSMKAETPVIRSTVHNLLLKWIEYLPQQLLLGESKCTFAELYQSISINLIRKMYVSINPFQRTPVHIVSYESRYIGSAISIRIVVTKYWCTTMHRWIVTPLIMQHKVSTRFCCSLFFPGYCTIPNKLMCLIYHFLHGWFTGTEAIIKLHLCHCSNSEVK